MARQLLAVVISCLSLVYFVNGNLLNLTEAAHNVYQCPDPSGVAASPLCQQKIEESGHLFQVVTKTIKCPETGLNTKKLACIIATNLDDNDAGGYSSVISGGLNDYTVDIYLESQRSKGLKFQIEIYTVS